MLEAIVGILGAVGLMLLGIGVRSLTGIKVEIAGLKAEFTAHRSVTEHTIGDHEVRLRELEHDSKP